MAPFLSCVAHENLEIFSEGCMFNNMSLQVRFALMLTVIFFVSLPLVGAAAYYVLQKNINEDVFEQAEFFLNTMESVRQQVGKVMRPAVQNYMGTRFDTRFMSTSFAARGVAERLKEKFPDYSFRHISLNPRNPVNQADSFEQDIILFFSKNRVIGKTKGFIMRDKSEFFYVAKPVVTESSCMQCHSIPHRAPREIISTYGSTAAFGWQPNQVVAALIVYVPTKLAKTHAFKALLTFMLLYAAVFLVILYIIDRAIVSAIIKPIKKLTAAAEELRDHSSNDQSPFS
jgi:hypothetical protein